jgi:protoporphyrinogen oxidase
MGEKVIGCDWIAAERAWQVSHVDREGNRHRTFANHVISSAPMRLLVQGITPPMSETARKAAASLKYRDFLTVMLILQDKNSFSDNWIYIHDPSVQVGRIQNFKSWSPEMVAEPDKVCYGLEYFCFEGDGLWNSPDEDLLRLAKRELATVGLGKPEDVLDGCVVRQPKAYPVYDDDYAKHVKVIAEELKERYPTMHLVGRNGMHKYNNQDHAMMTAMLCVKNILAGENVYDLWSVNQDAEYHESGNAGQRQEMGATGLRLVPTRLAPEPTSLAASPITR